MRGPQPQFRVPLLDVGREQLVARSHRVTRPPGALEGAREWPEETQSEFDVVARGPGQGRDEIVMVRVHHCDHVIGRAGDAQGLDAFGPPSGVGRTQPCELTGVAGAVDRERADRLQQPVAS